MKTNSFFELLRSFTQLTSYEVFTLGSFKGSRKLTRPPRKYGRRWRGHLPLIPLVIALDRYEHEADAVLHDKSYQQIAPALQLLLSRGLTLCTDGNQSYIQIAEENTGVIHKRLTISEHHRCRG